LETIVNSNQYTGYPVVTSRGLLVGYIPRSELAKGIRVSKQSKDVVPNTPCYFSAPPSDIEAVYVDFRLWKDSTPTQITPLTPLNIVVDLFKKMGMRYVLISEQGRLKGIITKKDMLRHITATHHMKASTYGSELYEDEDIVLS
jgi:chloride channel 3/4/5